MLIGTDRESVVSPNVRPFEGPGWKVFMGLQRGSIKVENFSIFDRFL